jgi:ubiquinone/menaquinone biosynthesis C-methylase UbiE
VFKLSTVLIASVAIAVSFAAVVAWRFAFFILPFTWTGESARLAELLHVRPGATVADIGAGDGSMAVEMARLVGRDGVVYATELSAQQREAITRRVSTEALSQMRVVEGATDATRLPAECCDAIYLRAVTHHLSDRARFAGEIRKAVRPGGRVAIIDFAPGSLWFHGADHGVTLENVRGVFVTAGFEVVEQIEDWGGGMFAVVFKRR